jgi:hypothetical protein
VAAAILSLAALWAPTAANASCALPPGGDALWKTADVVFVGTVTDIANNARWATVRVEEVWKGPDQPVQVVVRGGPEGNVATSVDRTYNIGTRYLFALASVDGALVDSACSGTTGEDQIDIDSIRPDDVREPSGDTPESGGTGPDLGALAGPVLVVGVIGGLLLATVLLARRRDA